MSKTWFESLLAWCSPKVKDSREFSAIGDQADGCTALEQEHLVEAITGAPPLPQALPHTQPRAVASPGLADTEALLDVQVG